MLTVNNLKKKFNLEAGAFAKYGRFVYAVNDVSFSIDAGETYGLVGESGCGKSTTARLLVKMYEADSGNIQFTDNAGKTVQVSALKGNALREYREKVKYVFQDPVRSLNPRMTVYDILTSGYKCSKRWPGAKEARMQVEQILAEVGLSALDLERRPTDFSGGQRQRISIARALLMQPELLICDEVVSALDVSIQGQILNLLQGIRQQRNLSVLFIAHDLKVSCYFCDRIGVMYKGFLMEEAAAADLYTSARHPYTKLLFDSVADSSLKEQQTAAGDAAVRNCNIAIDNTAPSAGNIETADQTGGGCPFAHRCPHATGKCRTELPPMTQIAEGHRLRCWL